MLNVFIFILLKHILTLKNYFLKLLQSSITYGKRIIDSLKNCEKYKISYIKNKHDNTSKNVL